MSRSSELLKLMEEEGVNPLVTADENPFLVITTPPSEGNHYEVGMAGDPLHTHNLELNYTEDGVSGKLIAGEEAASHEHEIINGEVKTASDYPHIHQIMEVPDVMPDADEAEKQWDDEVSDTKEKVKVMGTDANTRRVFDKSGKYMGTYDLRKADQKNKYKTMFRGGK